MNIRDHQGRFIAELPASAFRAKFRGEPVQVRSVQVPHTSPRVVLLLDASGSISQTGHTWDTARMVAGDFLSSSQGSVAVVIFASRVVVSLDFSLASTEKLQQVHDFRDVWKLVPKGERKTALFDAIMYAQTLLKEPSAGDSIYAITDGEDNASHYNLEEVERTLFTSGVRFFAFYMTENTFRTEQQIAVLHALADDSGGAVLDVPDTGASILYDLSPKGRARLSKQLSYLYDLMAHFYRLDVTLPAPVDKRRRWEWEVADERGHTRKDLDLFYPREVIPCRSALGQ